MNHLFAGVDVGAETIKYVIIDRETLAVTANASIPHNKCIADCLQTIFEQFRQENVEGCAICGRFAHHLSLRNYPRRAVQTRGLEHEFGSRQLTYITIGCNGFSVLERRGGGADIFRENSRCSQGTGNFLRQLVERFDLDLARADALCENVHDAAPLSGRCPVILKTDMTHLANRGDPQEKILAGVYDAICQNVEALIKTSMCPKDVVLSGGVTKSARIRRHFADFCEKRGLRLLEPTPLSQFYLEALGCACLAAERGADAVPAPDADLLIAARTKKFDRIPPLSSFLDRVKRLPPVPLKEPDADVPVFLGFDIGSTGSKAVALADCDGSLADILWEGYVRTNGNPVQAAHQLMRDFVNQVSPHAKVVGFGVTGSGREIVGSMLATCFGNDRIYIMNEIAAHAEGARTIDPRVDTIFEIGGQDAKYIRLSDARIVDCAMNEACSAGTGSFIEEQGKKFRDIDSLDKLSGMALHAKAGVSLGQHCSVFMTQVIEDAVAAGIETPAILAGIYDSVVLNYFYRVKGNRSVGDVVFCQGMPFASDALACAVVRQTHATVIVPPNPGTIGAFGIARLARKNQVRRTIEDAVCAADFLGTRLLERKAFQCSSNKGCGGAGNHCKIERITVDVNGKTLNFTWGGACSMWDRGTVAQKLPDRAPDPFRERADAVDRLVSELKPRGNRTIAIADEFQNKTFFVFFTRFLYELGFDLVVFKSEGLNDLKRGLDESNVQFCAPMQHFHGIASRMNDSDADFIFLPMMRSGKFSKDEEYAAICPVVQSSGDLLGHDLRIRAGRALTPVIDLGPGNLHSRAFVQSCRTFARELGCEPRFDAAFGIAADAFGQFEADLFRIGRTAIEFARTRNIPAVVVLGRNYTIHNTALNSNVPALLRTQGAMAIPVDCYPIDESEPLYTNTYWSYGQINLRAATQIRRENELYAVWCSNYSCGPDSFNLHFFQFIMHGKPYAIIETDGHSGDAGTKTRIEAFLHCIREFREGGRPRNPRDLHKLERQNIPLVEATRMGATLLIPPLGDNAETLAAGFRSFGIRCVKLPVPTRRTLHLGRRHTSGKECLPALVTLGGLLEYIEDHPEDRKIIFFMPRSNGPCRLGCYNLLDKIVLDRLGLADRVKVWSMTDTDYSEGVPKDLFVAIYASFIAVDTLMAGLLDVRPVESVPGAANAIYKKHYDRIIHLLENFQRHPVWTASVAREILSGRFFGVAEIVRECAEEFAKIKTDRRIPTVCVTGEIYVRSDPFSNDFVIEALESRGIRVLFSHFIEWIEYADIINHEILFTANTLTESITSHFTRYMLRAFYKPVAAALHWTGRHDVHHILATARPYLRTELVGEETVTIGTPLHAWHEHQIHGVISVGPLECMPSKIAESQFYHIAEKEGLPSLCLSFNGDPIPDSVLDDFCFTVRQTFERTK